MRPVQFLNGDVKNHQVVKGHHYDLMIIQRLETGIKLCVVYLYNRYPIYTYII